jgi:O-antigen/teichoic acid export membrane protein
MVGFFEAFFIAFERTGLMFFEQVSSNVIRLVGSFAVILMGYGLLEFVIVIVASGVAAVAACFYMFHRYIGPVSLKIDWKATWYLIYSSPAFLLTTLFGVVLSMRIDIIILSKMTDLVQVALYTAAFKLYETALILPQSFMTSFFPQLARLYSGDRSGFNGMIGAIFRNILFYNAAVITGMYLVSWFAIHSIFGGKFDGAVSPFKLLLFGLIPWSMAKVSGQVLIASGRQKLDMVSTMVATVSNIVLNFILIPRYGAAGAAIANTTSLAIFCLPQLWFARTVLRPAAPLWGQANGQIRKIRENQGK